MSNLKRDIEEILEPKCLRSGCEIKHRCNPKTATTQIINLIESVLPEEKEEYDQCDRGFNQAIKDIKSKLIGKE